jgi:hypothetical protein
MQYLANPIYLALVRIYIVYASVLCIFINHLPCNYASAVPRILKSPSLQSPDGNVESSLFVENAGHHPNQQQNVLILTSIGSQEALSESDLMDLTPKKFDISYHLASKTPYPDISTHSEPASPPWKGCELGHVEMVLHHPSQFTHIRFLTLST